MKHMSQEAQDTNDEQPRVYKLDIEVLIHISNFVVCGYLEDSILKKFWFF